jgi:hypothetical protein
MSFCSVPSSRRLLCVSSLYNYLSIRFFGSYPPSFHFPHAIGVFSILWILFLTSHVSRPDPSFVRYYRSRICPTPLSSPTLMPLTTMIMVARGYSCRKWTWRMKSRTAFGGIRLSLGSLSVYIVLKALVLTNERAHVQVYLIPRQHRSNPLGASPSICSLTPSFSTHPQQQHLTYTLTSTRDGR